jgi:hypothetical protein
VTITATTSASIGAPFINVADDSTDYPINNGTCTSGTNLATGQTCTFQVEFQPGVANPPNSFVIVDYGPPNSTPTSGAINIGLAGTTSGSQQVSVSPSPVDFGAVAVGSSATRTVTVGTAQAVDFGSGPTVSTGSPLTISNDTCTAAQPANSTCTFDVVYQPTETGTLNATVIVAFSVAGGFQPLSFGDQATGNAAATPPPISASPSSVTFPASPVGSASSPVTITLTATTSATIDAPRFNAAQDSTDYAIINGTCISGTALAAGQTCTFKVQFQPTVANPPNSFVIVDYGPPNTACCSGAIAVGLGNPANPPPLVPEAPLAILIPLTFAGLLMVGAARRRRRAGHPA